MRPSRRLLALLTALTSFITSSCGALFHGANQGVAVNTQPAGAVAIAGDKRTETPGSLEIPRRATSASIKIEKPGYHPQTVKLRRRTSALVWGNAGIILGGLLLAGAASLGESLGETGPTNTDTVFLATGIFAGVLGFAVDFGLGSAHRLEPDDIDTQLEPLQ